MKPSFLLQKSASNQSPAMPPTAHYGGRPKYSLFSSYQDIAPPHASPQRPDKFQMRDLFGSQWDDNTSRTPGHLDSQQGHFSFQEVDRVPSHMLDFPTTSQSRSRSAGKSRKLAEDEDMEGNIINIFDY